MEASQLTDLRRRYAAAWCSQDAASVAAFFAANGSLQINGGIPAVGRTAITAAAQDFMTAFPDMVVAMDGVGFEGPGAVFHWTLTGGPLPVREERASWCASPAVKSGRLARTIWSPNPRGLLRPGRVLRRSQRRAT